MFDRSLLPAPEHFYRGEFDRLPRPSRGWVQVKCCFHDDRRPSLSLNLREGNFLCHGCGTKGGDVVSFVMQRNGLSFRRATESLGAWVDSSEQSRQEAQRERTHKRRERERISAARDAIITEERRLRIDTREYLHTLDRIDRDISARLRNDPQEDLYWQILSLLPDEKRRAVSTYALLSFGSAENRVRFVRDASSRESMISEVMSTGFVRSESSMVEVPL